MNTPRDRILSLVESSKGTWDFAGVAAEIREAVDALQRDGTLIELSKKPIVNIANVALKALEERQRSAQHLQQALISFERQPTALSDDQLRQLAAWFFKIAYSGNAVSPDLERLVRPVLARTQPDVGENVKKFRNDFEIYSRLAAWGTDTIRSTNNLAGLAIAVRVVPLSKNAADEIGAKCEKALAALATRRNLSQAELAKQSLATCRELIMPTWTRYARKEECYLDRQASRALHTCLYGLLETVVRTEELADVAQEMSEEVNTLRARFEQVRFPSSSTLLARVKQEIQGLDRKLGSNIDFAEIKLEIADLKGWIGRSLNGRHGINRMHEVHVDEANLAVDELFQKVERKEQDPAELDSEMRLFEEAIQSLEQQSVPLIASPLKRLLERIRPNSPLLRWAAACPKSSADREIIDDRIKLLRSRLSELWKRMEAQQDQRVAEFRQECTQLDARISTSVELRRTLSEISELARCIDEFTQDRQPELRRDIKRLNDTFARRASNVEALHELIRALLLDVDRAHRRIFSVIDFDALNARAEYAKEWLWLRDFPRANFEQTGQLVSRCFGDIRKLRFRQEKAKAERQARANEVAAELMTEVRDVLTEVGKNPGRPEVWQSLVDLDRAFREIGHLLTDAQRQPLSDAINSGFKSVREARAAFAAEAAKAFAQYNDALSDVLFALEEDATKNAAFEAIERIKPIRAELRNDTRLQRRQRDELYALVSQISSSIDEIFEQANAQAAKEFQHLRADIERLDGEVKDASNWQTANALIETHKQLSARIRDAQVKIAERKEFRAEMDRLWEEISERLRLFRSTRSQTEDLDAVFARLERQGYLMLITEAPSIA